MNETSSGEPAGTAAPPNSGWPGTFHSYPFGRDVGLGVDHDEGVGVRGGVHAGEAFLLDGRRTGPRAC